MWPTAHQWMLGLPFLVSVIATGLSIPLAHAIAVLDQPGALKVHARVTPRFGGIGIIAAVLLPVFLFRLAPPLAALGLLAIAVVGGLDDKFCLRPSHKLLGEALAGLLLGLALAGGPLGPVAVPLALMLVIALANAVNLIDGLDGLAAGYTAVAAAGFALVMAIAGLSPALAAVLSLAALGFLLWNFPTARTFMGDVGSLGIGYCLAYLLLSIGQHRGAVLVSALPLVAIPLCDMALGIARRWIRGRPILQGDRDHFYDVLNRKLGNPVLATLVVYGLALLFLGLGLLATRISTGAALGIYAALLLGLIPLSVQAGFLPRRRGYRAQALPELTPSPAPENAAAAGAAEETDRRPVRRVALPSTRSRRREWSADSD
jgi:UDP-GlcNAc:undecaprenyl-phosphate GlcNAc-1-phosphate transferase